MAHLRHMENGRWQATVRLPDGRRRSATHTTRHAASEWGDHMEIAASHLADAAPGATFTWTTEGLDIHIPDSMITMDMATKLEQTLHRVLGQDI
ncbi:hypothetical protein [Nonomuraea sp. NPDC049646]|uniref:hypothetical protein n=1 Tax=unclassified Nonomuraea TaxID=2593643 RepID=UPI003791CFDC